MAEKEKIERLKLIRAGHRGVVPRHINEARTILEYRCEPGHVEEELTVAQMDRLNLISLLLLEKEKTLSKIDQEELELCELTKIEREIQESENIVPKILETKRLKSIRAGHRGVVTRHINEARTILEYRCEPGHVEEELTVAQMDRLNLISLLLLEKEKTLSKIDQEELELCELTKIEREIQESENIVPKILETKQQIEDVQKEVQVETDVNRTSNASETRSDRSSVTERRTFATPRQVKPERLPKLVLPKFRGDITTFSTFTDSFESAIDKNPERSVIDKFSYLSSLVEGPAARTLQGLTFSEANYEAAKEFSPSKT